MPGINEAVVPMTEEEKEVIYSINSCPSSDSPKLSFSPDPSASFTHCVAPLLPFTLELSPHPPQIIVKFNPATGVQTYPVLP